MCDSRPRRIMVDMSAQAWWRLVVGPQRDLEQGRAPHAHGQTLTMRYATPDDATDLEQLAELDSRRPPRGVVLLADVDGELWAAVSLDDGDAVAHPFRPSGELRFRLSERARELNGTGGDRPRARGRGTRGSKRLGYGIGAALLSPAPHSRS
jgi:hypothetical protein